MEIKKYFQNRLSSFGYAFKGLLYMVKNEPNALIHIVVMIIAAALGVFLRISLTEWCLLAVVSGMVIASEAINSSVEQLVDLVTTDFNETARKAKDLGAGAVLVSAFAAVIAGIVIFMPKIFNMLRLFF